MFKGKLISADFEESTMEFEIQHEFTVKKGEYVILSKEEHERLVNNLDIPVVSKPLRKPKLTKKMIEARDYVDKYTKTNKRPPTYDEVRIFLGLASTNTAFHRLRGYREKMY